MGERIEVQASQDGVVQVKSRCAWPLQLIDWGKNRTNTDAFLDGLSRLLAM
jgi:hypothetical protein